MNETLYFSMSETARRAKVATATLRKWASRYNIDASHRSPGGHRLYSENDIERLQRVSELKGRGWALQDLAILPLEELQRMTPLDTSEDIPGLISFCGTRVVDDFSPWFAERSRVLDESDVNVASGVLVWEVGSLSDQHVSRAQRLAQAGVPVLLVYHYALKRRLQQLEAGTVVAVAGPLTWHALMKWLLDQSPKPVFSDDQLQQLRAMNPILECECSQHLAELLIKLREFADYCQQCSMDSPAQADLHHQLYHWTQAAQRPLETGLLAVVSSHTTPEP